MCTCFQVRRKIAKFKCFTNSVCLREILLFSLLQNCIRAAECQQHLCEKLISIFFCTLFLRRSFVRSSKIVREVKLSNRLFPCACRLFVDLFFHVFFIPFKNQRYRTLRSERGMHLSAIHFICIWWNNDFPFNFPHGRDDKIHIRWNCFEWINDARLPWKIQLKCEREILFQMLFTHEPSLQLVHSSCSASENEESALALIRRHITLCDRNVQSGNYFLCIFARRSGVLCSGSSHYITPECKLS